MIEENKSQLIWNSCKKKTLILEWGAIIISIFLVILGTGFDLEVFNGKIRFYVEEFNSYILALLGIQATISTLTIAIVALISNNISETFMGISVSHYYLNIRPQVFKQRSIIIISLILTLVGCACYVFCLYNLLVSIFVATIILVIVSVCELYHLFRGLQKAKDEIESYIVAKTTTRSNNDKEILRNLDIFSDFISDWISKSCEQTPVDYNKYLDVYLKILSELLTYNKQAVIDIIKENASKQIDVLFSSDSNAAKARGIELLNDVYSKLWSFVISKNYQAGTISHFDLFASIDESLYANLIELPAKMSRDAINWGSLSDYIPRCSFYFLSSENSLKNTIDMQSLLRISNSIGSIIKYKEEYKNENIADMLTYWGRNLSRPYLQSAYNIPAQSTEDYLKYRCKVYLYLCKGIIDNEYMQVVKENIYMNSILNTYSISKYEALYYLSINCYLYYLSERESLQCITKEMKIKSKELLDDENVINANEHLIYKIANNKECLEGLENNLMNLLKDLEWFPKFDNAKHLIMDNVTREFYVFLTLLVFHENSYFEELNLEINEPLFVYINQFLGDNEKSTKERLQRFYTLFHRNTNNSKSAVDDMYKSLERFLQAKCVNDEVKQAQQEQEKYLHDVDEKAVIVEIQEKIKQHFEDVFGQLDVNKKDKHSKWTIKLNLFNCDMFTDMINSNIAEEFYDNIDSALVVNIISELLKRNLIHVVKRKQFKDDDKFMQFIKNGDYETLIGPEFVFRPSNYLNKDKFDDIIKNYRTIFCGYFKIGGLLLKKKGLRINVKGITASIRPVTLSDVEYTYDETRDLYTYKLTNNMMIPFQKDELVTYLNNKRKLLNISVEIELVSKNKNVGSLITRNEL